MITRKLISLISRFKFSLGNLQNLNPATLQRQQLVNLIILFVTGKLILNLPITWFETASIVLFTILVDHIFLYQKLRRFDFFSYSAVNTALGVVFLLRVVEFEIYLVVIFLAIAQKHWLKINNRHFLNPSNVAVVAGLLFFPYETYTTPEQWGAFWWLGVIMTLLGLLITFRVGRVLIPITFSVFYFVLTYLFITRNLIEILFTLVSGSFLLFIYFMLTDPRTTPEKHGYQIVFALAIAVLTTFLEIKFGAREITMFLALFIVSLFIPLIRIAQNKSRTAWGYVFGAGVAGCLVAAFSPLNGLERLSTIQLSQAFSKPIDVAVKMEDKGSSKLINWDSRKDWYPITWLNPHTLSTPLKRHSSDSGFSRVEGGLPVSKPGVQRHHFGMDYNYHAPITAGDINHDGWTDLVIGRLGKSLAVLINNGDGTFFDATWQLFDQLPINPVEQVVLADFDSDSYLDLLVVFNPFISDTGDFTHLYRFEPATRKFEHLHSFNTSVRASSGGVALVDINQDRILDPYISYSHDWYQDDAPPAYFMMSDGVSNQFWVSAENGWIESRSLYFPVPDEEHAGMTVMFTDLNNDGKLDFLLGNDMQPDLSYIQVKQGRFELIPKEKIEYNVFNSMGYLALDVDNDGINEIWEHGISFDVFKQRTRYGLFVEDALREKTTDNLIDTISQSFRIGKSSECADDSHSVSQKLCLELSTYNQAIRLGDRSICEYVENLERKKTCLFAVDRQRFSHPQPQKMKRDVEKFPRKIKKNVLLKLNESGRYENVIAGDKSALTGWSWAAYPYDLDNNGYQDLLITTGMSIFRGSEPPALLMNHSQQGKIRLVNQTRNFGLDFKDEGRGLIVTDLDGDGDGDVIINNLYSAPIYLRNHFGGSSIEVELRSRNSNYFAIGSRIELHTDRGMQVREISVGGVWDSAQPPIQHFGLANGETIHYLRICWPNGTCTNHNGIVPDQHYAFFD